MKVDKNIKIAIVGLGKVGYALLNKLLDCGYYIYSAVERSNKLIKKIKKEQKYNIIIKKSLNFEDLNNSDVIIISVKDDEIESVCEQLKKYKKKLADKIIFHTSGTLSSKLLTKYFNNKNNAGSFQPVQSFNVHSIKQKDKFINSYILLEGGRNFLTFAKKVCKSFNSKYLVANEREKRLFHIISVFASNYLVTYINELCNGHRIKKLSPKKVYDVIKPLIKNTLENIEKSKYFYEALSGPIERGDISTIKTHLNELKSINITLYILYKLLGFHTIELALKKKSINSKTATKIRNVLLDEK